MLIDMKVLLEKKRMKLKSLPRDVPIPNRTAQMHCLVPIAFLPSGSIHLRMRINVFQIMPSAAPSKNLEISYLH